MKKKETKQESSNDIYELEDFPIDVKKDILQIINDSPTIVKLGDKEYVVKNLRMYSINRIGQLCIKMREKDTMAVDDDKKILSALCTDLDAMCEIMAIILCNHLFRPDDIKDYEDVESTMSRNDKWIKIMKMKVMNSTFDDNQWAAIILGALKSIDLGGFFLFKKSVSMLIDSMMMRKMKSMETVSRFTEAQSLLMQQTS